MTEYDFLAYLLQSAPTLAIFFFLWKAGIIKLGSGEAAETTPPWAQKLTEHYNEETTEKLDTMLLKQDEMKDCLKKANVKLDEIKEYGVRIRQKETA